MFLDERSNFAFAGRGCVVDEGVVELRANDFFGDCFEVLEIDDHVARAGGVFGDGDFDAVGVAVEVFAEARVVGEDVGGVECKGFGDGNHEGSLGFFTLWGLAACEEF